MSKSNFYKIVYIIRKNFKHIYVQYDIMFIMPIGENKRKRKRENKPGSILKTNYYFFFRLFDYRISGFTFV